jgi:HD-GYP domain-containing protein (c-di-GMP phosphodiesterase class II)
MVATRRLEFRKAVDGAFVVASIVTLLFLVVYTAAGALGPYSGLEIGTDWIVQNVSACEVNDPFCESDRNALQPGDQILAIGNLTRGDYLKDQNRVAFYGYSAGEPVTLSFLRAGGIHSVEWLMPIRSADSQLSAWEQIIICIPFWAAGSVILFLFQPRDERWRVLILTNYTTAAYLIVGLAGKFVPFAFLALHALTWLMVPMYLHLHLIIPNPLLKKGHRIILFFLYTLATALFVLEILHALPDRAFYLGLVLIILGSLGLLAYRLFTKLNESERLALRMMFVGIGMALGPGLLLWVIPSGLARVPQSTALIFSCLAIPLMPFFYIYAIYRRRLGGFELRANRVLTLYTFTLLYGLLIVLIFSFAGPSLNLGDQSMIFSLVVTLVAVLAAMPLRARYQRFFDRYVFGIKHDPQMIVREFALQLPAAFKPELLVRLLIRDVMPSLFVRESALYQKTETGFSLLYAEEIALPDPADDPEALSHLLKAAGEYRTPEDTPPGKYDWVRLAVGLQSGGKEIGVWLFGRRDPDDYYSANDILLLRTLGSQVAPMLENIRLYAETQRRLERLQALRDIDITISSSLDLNFTLEILLDQVSRRSNVDAVDVLLLNLKTTTLEFVAGRGFRSDALRHTHLRLGEGYAGQSALERRMIFVQNLSDEAGGFSRSPKLSAEGFKSYCATPLIVKGQVKGVLEVFYRTALTPDPDWFDFLQSLTVQAAIAIDNASLFDELQHSNAELNLAYDTTIEGWSRALDLRDEGTEGHTERVTEMTERLALALGVDESELVHIRRGALLHDMGKMGIPDSILLKRGALTNSEWEIMRRHPVYAHEMLSHIIYLKRSLDIPYCHHEKWDGTGYPRGLKGEEIPLAARIFAVVDVWDATTSDRPYRVAWPQEKARAFILEESGKYFDPHIVTVFLSLIDRS